MREPSGMGANVDRPSERVVSQRIRNRLIEYFSWASSFEEQRDYQAVAPIWVPGEVFEQFYDTVREPVVASDFDDVYSAGEIDALIAYSEVLDRARDETPDAWTPLEEFQALPLWEEVRQAAEAAREAFARRGPLPEDVEA